MSRINQLLCIHTTAFFILTVGGAFVVAGWVPPPSPDQSPAELAATFDDATNVRIAAAMMFFGGAFFLVPMSAITTQLRRIEGPTHVMANLQICAAAVGVLALQIPGALWLAISYRDGVPDWVVVTLNDVSWFFLLGAVGSAIVQNLAIAFGTFAGDGSIYPRWLAYANLWLCTGLFVGVFIPFVKDGPVAWDGVLGFWVVATDFFAWVILMWVLTVKAINRQESTA